MCGFHKYTPLWDKSYGCTTILIKVCSDPCLTHTKHALQTQDFKPNLKNGAIPFLSKCCRLYLRKFENMIGGRGGSVGIALELLRELEFRPVLVFQRSCARPAPRPCPIVPIAMILCKLCSHLTRGIAVSVSVFL